MKVFGYKPVQYRLELNLEAEPLVINELVGEELKIEFNGIINCKKCGRTTKKSFSQGFCYPCFRDAPENAECILRPELCRGHLGEGRDVEWEQKNHVQDHFVYLALTANLKVGVTRATQIPIRWIDQGAFQAIQLLEVPNRYLAGYGEVSLKDHFSDKTAWQRMLKNQIDDSVDLLAERERAISLLPEDLLQYVKKDAELYEIEYPVLQYPEKVKSINLDKTPLVEGKLVGVKGQYLLFEDNRVMNIRKHTGYYVDFGVKS